MRAACWGPSPARVPTEDGTTGRTTGVVARDWDRALRVLALFVVVVVTGTAVRGRDVGVVESVRSVVRLPHAFRGFVGRTDDGDRFPTAKNPASVFCCCRGNALRDGLVSVGVILRVSGTLPHGVASSAAAFDEGDAFAAEVTVTTEAFDVATDFCRRLPSPVVSSWCVWSLSSSTSKGTSMEAREGMLFTNDRARLWGRVNETGADTASHCLVVLFVSVCLHSVSEPMRVGTLGRRVQ
jgi:hypothetical protein